jgi:hypothetical protein
MPKVVQEVPMLADVRVTPSLDPVEWRVVAIALQDADRAAWIAPDPGSLRGKIAGLYTRVTGTRPARTLADPRLDTLRRFVHATRRARAVAEPLVPAMIASGFNRKQVEAIALLST